MDIKEKRKKHAEYMRRWRAKNRQHNLAYRKSYYNKNKQHIRVLAKIAWKNKKDRINSLIREERKKNPEKFRKLDAKRYTTNPKKILDKNKRCFEKHRKQYLDKKREYAYNHKEQSRLWRKQNLNHLIDYNRMKRGSCRPYQFARQNYCLLCGMTNEQSIKVYGRRLDIHHIDGNLLNNDTKNLMTLCRRCHKNVELIKPLILNLERTISVVE